MDYLQYSPQKALFLQQLQSYQGLMYKMEQIFFKKAIEEIYLT